MLKGLSVVPYSLLGAKIMSWMLANAKPWSVQIRLW